MKLKNLFKKIFHKRGKSRRSKKKRPKKRSMKRSNFRQMALRRKLKVFSQALVNYLPLISVVIFIGLMSLFVYRFLSQQEFLKEQEQVESVEEVKGISVDIETYPGAEFAFEDYDQEQWVKKLFSYDMTCYLIPYGDEFEDVKKYYSDNLGEKGWEIVGEVNHGDDSGELGVYFKNKEREKGLRLYSIYQDVWYEVINYKEAESKLKGRQQLKSKLRHTIQSLHGDTLPDEYPFYLRYSFEYELKKWISDEFPTDTFILEGRDERIQVIPFRWETNIDLEDAISLYLSTELEDVHEKPNIIKTVQETHNEIEYRIATVELAGKSYQVASFVHPGQRIIYIVNGLECDKALFEYVVENMELKDK